MTDMRWLTQTLLLQLLLAGLGLLWLAASKLPEHSPWTVQEAAMTRVDAATLAAALALPEEAWRPLDQAELARWHAPYWLRFRIQAPAIGTPEAWILTLSLRAASELYWGGQLLGRNGRVGANAADEVPGRIDSQFLLDRDRSGPGEHVLLIHASSQHAGSMATASAGIRVLSYAQARRYAWRWLIVALALGAIASALAYWAIALRATPSTQARDRGRVWLLALGVVGLLLPLAESWRPVFGYTYDWHALRLGLIFVLHAAAALLLAGCLMARNPAATRRHYAALGAAWLLLLVVAGGASGYDMRSWLMQAGGLVLALIVGAVQWRRQPEIRPLHGLLLSGAVLAVASPAAFLDGLYFIVLALMMVCLMLDHAAHARRLGERHAQLSAERDRLRLQLLRRAIQPHWLMNSLTTLQELIDRAPQRATQLVELLAEHFAMLRAHSERDQVSLAEEVALCRVQLDIAGLAQERAVPMRIEGELSDIQIPPGILHCLVENGLTHAGFRACADQGYALRIERVGARVRLTLDAPLGAGPANSCSAGGTGTRYVRASLARMWSKAASFEDGPRNGRWHSEMEWPCAS